MKQVTPAGRPHPHCKQVQLQKTPAQFFAAVAEAYQQACASTTYRVRRDYRFGPSQLAWETPCPSLAGFFTRALGEGANGAIEPGSLIWAWDERSTGVACPSPPWGHYSPYTRRGDVPCFQDPRYLCAYNSGSQVLCLYDREERRGIYWTRDAERLPGWEQTAPMRTLLHWHGLAHELQMTHGAVVDGLLLAGKGGSGKSTTALACLEAGMPFLCDDYCYISVEPEPTAYGILANARVFAHSLDWLPELAQLEQRVSDEKVSLNLDSRRVPEMSLRAILLPRVASNHHGAILETASLSEALKAVALPTMAQLPGAGPETYAILSKLCQELPVYHFLLNRPACEIPDLLKELAL
jgi:hypothetical protein